MTHRLLAAFLLFSLLSSLVPAALAQETTAQPDCTMTANGSVNAYESPDASSQVFPLTAGDGGYVAGETTDGQWIGFDPGIAQAANMGLTRLKWVQATADITLAGGCANLPMIDPPPSEGCYLTFNGDTSAYRQPDTSAPIVATLSATDYAVVAGQLADGWYGWSDPGAQAGSTGTIQLKWINANDGVQLNGNCDPLTTFYPVPKLKGDICTLLTNSDAKAYVQPSTDADATDLPGLLVQVLAKTPMWYGYDPGDDQFGTVGVTRMRWIQASTADQLNGDCADVPTIDPAPTQIGPEENNTSISVKQGDSIEIMLPGENPDTGSAWSEKPDQLSDSAILQLQGAQRFGPSGDKFGSRAAITLTYQAVGTGTTTLALVYIRGNSASTLAPDDQFTVTVTVTAPK